MATLTGERDIHLVLDGSPIEFNGRIELRHTASGFGLMTLTQRGGADDGKTWTFRYDSYA